ncbi:FAD-dependent oxidoreductase [Streptomyces sp. NPDC005708]|uniref:NAD(P)/FAD-dependent oxidoreductase n=1 Tax=Streptomyces sp. NPDC005708 TaxID=3154564 RepID=UPI00340DB40B
MTPSKERSTTARRERCQLSNVLVVGSSLAGLRFVESARRHGYDGRLRLVGAENHLPYDRPPMSKAFLTDGRSSPGDLQYKGEKYYDDLDVDLLLGTPAEGLDLAAKEIRLADGSRMTYDRLLIATGSRARWLPGADTLDGVFTLRTVDDAVAIRDALDQAHRVVVIGSGFIGSEVAASARARGLDVTVLEALRQPLVRTVGPVLGERLGKLHEQHGTMLRCAAAVERLEGRGRVEGVRLTDGTVLRADVVVCGVGAVPATDWLADSGLPVDDGVIADATLQVTPDVYAVGDVVRWQHDLYGASMRVEHWTTAADQGAAAAKNLFGPGAPTPYVGVPYFWSDWYDDRIQFVGVPSAESHVVLGSLEDDRFVAAFRDGGRIVGALALNWPTMIMKYRALIARSAPWSDVRALVELAS